MFGSNSTRVEGAYDLAAELNAAIMKKLSEPINKLAPISLSFDEGRMDSPTRSSPSALLKQPLSPSSEVANMRRLLSSNLSSPRGCGLQKDFFSPHRSNASDISLSPRVLSSKPHSISARSSPSGLGPRVLSSLSPNIMEKNLNVPEVRRFRAQGPIEKPAELSTSEEKLETLAAGLSKQLGTWSMVEIDARDKFSRLLKTGLDAAFSKATVVWPAKVQEAMNVVSKRKEGGATKIQDNEATKENKESKRKARSQIPSTIVTVPPPHLSSSPPSYFAAMSPSFSLPPSLAITQPPSTFISSPSPSFHQHPQAYHPHSPSASQSTAASFQAWGASQPQPLPFAPHPVYSVSPPSFAPPLYYHQPTANSPQGIMLTRRSRY